MTSNDLDQQLTGLAGLGDPLRRALYRYVVERGEPVSREDAARAVGISRPLAAYHLDKLLGDGLLEARYQHRSGRRGPGAGRPAKHYVQAARQLELSLPARDYAALAELLARAVEADPSGAAQTALNRAAASLGADLAAEAAGHAGTEDDSGRTLAPLRGALAAQTTNHPQPQPEGEGDQPQPAPGGDPDPALAALRGALAARGYQPYEEPDAIIRLRNCPFDRIAAQHRDLVCGANHAMLQALTDHLDSDPPVQAVLDPQPGHCCVALHPTS